MDRNALNRATESSDSPTPGYLYVDIAKSAGSSPTASQEILQYLIKRLQTKNNPNVKYKCLKVIAKTAESSVTRGHFKRAVAQNPNAVGAIKECLQFRGPPDPVRGEEPCQRVRDAAKEALDAAYSDSPSSSDLGSGTYGGIGGGGFSGGGISGSYGAPPHAGGAMGGYGMPGGGGVGPAPGGGGGGGPRKMEGIGNPMHGDPRLQQQKVGMSVREVAAVAGETVVAMIKDPLAKNVQVPPRQSGPTYSGPPGRNELSHATGGQWTMASNRGLNAVGPPQNFNSERDEAYLKARDGGSNAFQWAQQNGAGGGVGTSASSGGVGGSWGAAPAAVPPRPSGSMSVAAQARAAAHGTASMGTPGSGGAAASDGTYEKNLIMELCPPGGMKAEPPPEKLEAFIRSVPSLNPDLICPALLDALEDGQPWIIKAKALCVIERIIKAANETDGESNPYSDFFHACSAEIEPLASHNRAAIRDPARRVLQALGIDGSSASAVAATARNAPAPAAAPPAEPPNLLDFGDDTAPSPAPSLGRPTAPPPAASPPQPAPEASDGGDIFGGLTVQGGGAPAPPASPAPAPAPAAPSGGLFGNMTVKASVPKATTPSPASAATNGTAQVSSPESADLFANATEKPPAEKADSAEAAISVGKEAAGSGSAFGFISGNASSSSLPKAPAPEEPPASPKKEAFDPLLSLGTEPTNAQKVQQTQVQIAQMQAMAYQQNMMMMQQQMQQMQLAMVMQQQGKVPRKASAPPTMMAGAGGPINPNVMRANSMKRQIPGTGDASSSFSFLDNPNQSKKEDTHAFDFVMDSMKTEKK